MKDVNQIKVGATLGYIEVIIGIILDIIITPIVVRYVGDGEFGIINLSSSMVSYLGLITCGITGAFIRFNMTYRVKGDKEGEQKLNATFMIIYLVMCILILIAGLGLIFGSDKMYGASNTPEEIRKIKIVLGLQVANSVIALPFTIFHVNILAYEKFIFGKVLTIVMHFLQLITWIPVVVSGGLSISLTIATCCITMFSNIVHAIYAFKVVHVKFKFGKIDPKLLKSLFAFSFFILLNQAIDVLNTNLDNLVLGVIAGVEVVGIYAVGASYNTYLMTFSNTIGTVMVPRVNRLVAENAPNEEIQALFNKVGRIQFIVVAFVVLGFGFFGKSFIVDYLFTPNHLDAYYVSILLITPMLIPLVQNLAVEIQRAKNMHKHRTLILLAMTLLNLGLSIPLGKEYGAIGCALATCISLLLGNGIAMNIYYHFAMKLNVVNFWWQIIKFLPAIVLPTIAGALMMVYVDFSVIGNYIGCIIGFILIYMLSMYFIGMNKYEKDLVTRPFKKLFQKKTVEE